MTSIAAWFGAALLALSCQQEAGASSQPEPAEVQPPKVEAKIAAAQPADAKEVTKLEPGASSPTEQASQPAPEAEPGSQRSLVVEQPAFRIWLESPSKSLKTGETTNLQAVLEAKDPYHCNAEYPHKFKLDPAPPSLAYPAKVAKGMKVTEKRGVLAVPVEAKASGDGEVSGNLMFSVCTDERCLVEKQPLTLALHIE